MRIENTVIVSADAEALLTDAGALLIACPATAAPNRGIAADGVVIPTSLLDRLVYTPPRAPWFARLCTVEEDARAREVADGLELAERQRWARRVIESDREYARRATARPTVSR